MSDLADLIRSHAPDLSNRQIAERAGLRAGTVDRVMNRVGQPKLETVDKLAHALKIPVERAREAAGRPRGSSDPYVPPAEARLLDVRQRRALDELIRSIVATKGATDEDQGQTNSPHDPPATREARTDGTPMSDEDEFAGEHPDTVAQVHAIRKRMADHPGEWEGRSAARGDDLGPSDGELRRRPGADAGEENQDPGDDWDGA